MEFRVGGKKKGLIVMQWQTFMERMKSYPGISLMLKVYGYLDILKQAAELSGANAEIFACYSFEGYKRAGKDIPYRYILEDLIRNILFYDWTFEHLADNVSKVIFTRLVQYQVLPERSFLQRMVEEESNPCFPVSEEAVKSGEILVLEA